MFFNVLHGVLVYSPEAKFIVIGAKNKRIYRYYPLKCFVLVPLIQFFPRASERRVLPIVGVCISSSHLHTFSSSHLLIFTSAHLHICSSSHLLIFTSAHLHIFTYSHLHFLSLALTYSHTHIFSLSLSLPLSLSLSPSPSLSLSLSLPPSLSLSLSPLSSLLSLSPFSLPFLSLAFFIFLSLGRGWCRRGVTKRQPFRTK